MLNRTRYSSTYSSWKAETHIGVIRAKPKHFFGQSSSYLIERNINKENIHLTYSQRKQKPYGNLSSIEDEETAITGRVIRNLTTGGKVFLIQLIGVSWKHLLLLLSFFNESINGTV